MRDRRMSLLGSGAALAVIALFGLGAVNELRAQPSKVPATTATMTAIPLLTFCQNSCDQKYQSCVLGRAINEMKAGLAAMPGYQPGKAPKQDLPFEFPFGFEEENAPPKKKVTDPLPSCSSLRTTCLARCKTP